MKTSSNLTVFLISGDYKSAGQKAGIFYRIYVK